MKCECGAKLTVYYCRPEEHGDGSYIVRFRKCNKCGLRDKTIEKRTASYRKGDLYVRDYEED